MSTSIESLKPFIREGTPQAIIERYIALEDIAESTDFGCLDSNIVVVDTETTGLSFTKDELIQIAAARIENGKIIDWFVSFVNPGQEISDDIEHLTHISNDDVRDAPEPNVVLNSLVEFIGDAVILAHNVQFDKNFLTKHASGYPLLENIWVDTLDLVRIAFPRLSSHRLIDLSKAFNVIESTHRADDDVATTCEIYRLVLAAITQMPYELIQIISDIASQDMWPTVYIFEQMLNIIPTLTDDFELLSSDESLSSCNETILDEDFVNNKVNVYSMIKTMRKERFISIPVQKKYDIEIEDCYMQSNVTDLSTINTSSMQFPTENDLVSDFKKTGLLGKIYSDYEEREEQRIMAKEVLSAFRDENTLIMEAGTGVGKSMAYLIPAIRIAKENKITIGIATKTNSLLDQLIYHELPALSSQIDNLVYSSLKGARHYICLRKAIRLFSSKARMIKYKDEEYCNASSIAILLSFIEQTSYDDCDGIKINGKALHNSAYTCASHECLKQKCPFYFKGCFVHDARRKAQNSDIVITNHSMLFCNFKTDGGILPPIRYWIIDEAHSAENEARAIFSKTVSASFLLDYAKNFESDNAKKNIFVKTERSIEKNSDDFMKENNLSFSQEQEYKSIVYGLINKCKTSAKDLSKCAYLYANNICLLLDFSQKSNQGYEFANVWINEDVRCSENFNQLWKYAKEFNESAENLITDIQKLIAYLDDYDSYAVLSHDLSVLIFDLKEIIDAGDVIFFNNNESYVYSANINTKKTIKFDKITAELYSVSDILNEKFYNTCKSIVFTSATLAIGDNFDSFKDGLGLHFDKVVEKKLYSSFNYDKNMLIYVANDIPDPNSEAYIDKLSDFLSDLHIAGNGSILSLFTNRRVMERVYEPVNNYVSSKNLRILVQKWALSVKTVKDEFLANETVSLFALKNFWEGFDAPGSTLKAVVICRLPFPRLDNPLNLERQSRESNWWIKYALPESIIETKQAVGRLIRKNDDKGYIVFCDIRLVSKSYGKIYIDSLPTSNIKFLSCNDIVDEVKNLDV